MGVTKGGSAIDWNGTRWGNFQQVDGISSLSVNDPASDPYVVGVGGTDMTSPSTPPVETVWNERMNSGGGGGGGISAFWSMPSWQQKSTVPGVINSYSTGNPCNASSGSDCREVPDVSASADPYHPYVVYYKGNWTAYGGTSAATPTWAALVALADEEYGATDTSSGKVINGLGFLDPTLYSIAASTSSAFNNITSGNNDWTGTNPGDYPAASSTQRYSLAAGLGSPNGSVLIPALASSTPPQPTITSITPTSGLTSGGTSVSITGTGFTSGATVMFGTVTATAVTVSSSTSLTAVSPAESAGTVQVTVTTAGGTSATSSADQFTYVAVPTVTSISPTSGPTSGGTSVTITGTNFTSSATVDFGSTAATSVTYNSATSLTAVSPAESAGAVDVTVTTTGGTSATSSADQFTYVAVPTVTSISPTSGPTSGGTSVTITGTGFTSSATVDFGSTAATSVTYNSSTSLTATSPAESAGTVNVTVTTAGGTSATSSADQFTYLPGYVYVPVTPFRICDTRSNNPSNLSGTALSQCEGKTLAANSSLTIQVAGLGSVPISATGAVLNVTAIMPTQPTYLTVYPSSDTTRPTASNLNANTDTTVANLVEVQLPVDGKVTIYNFTGQVNVAVDVEGYTMR